MNTAQALLDDLYTKTYGYLSALDIAMWIDPQLMISAENRRRGAIAKAVRTALSLVSSKLLNFYDLKEEFLKSDTIPATFKATVAAGIITQAAIVTPGTNYITAPIVQVTPVQGGINGAITAQVSPAVIQAVQLLQGGGGYTSAPAVSFEGGDGVGAVAYCMVSKGTVTGVYLTNGGTGWTSPPKVVFTGDGCGAAATALVAYGKVTNLVINVAGTGYTLAPTLTAVGGQAEDSRNDKLVMICAINAVRCLVGNAENVSDKMQADFKMSDELLHEVENATGNLPLMAAGTKLRNTVALIPDKYNNLG